MNGEKTKSEIEIENAERGKFGDDPNAIDRHKFFGCERSASGKWCQKIGDEYFPVDFSTAKELEEKWKQVNK
jgi:hypothetical protein